MAPLIACSLDSESQQRRLAEWVELLRRAATREELADGARYSFAAAGELEQQIRDLGAAEQRCCSFLSFDVSRSDDRIELTVTAPAGGQDALRFIFAA